MDSDQTSQPPPPPQAATPDAGGGEKQLALEAPPQPAREDYVQNAVKFLSHPEVRGSTVVYRHSFLQNKGLTNDEIDEAFRRVRDPQLTTASPSTHNLDRCYYYKGVTRNRMKPLTSHPPADTLPPPAPMDELAIDPPPPLPLDDMLMEIFLRLPPEPIHLFCASFVSKHWRGLIHDARFLRRFSEFHGKTPPILGFFTNETRTPLFAPTSDGFTLSTSTMSHRDWWVLDCRRGRALVDNLRTGTLLVWDLMTGHKRFVTLPTQACHGQLRCSGTVLCAAGHADHDCHSCPFLVAFLRSDYTDSITSAWLYSSETGIWGEITSIHTQNSYVYAEQTALVGNTLYYLLNHGGIIGFDLDKNSLDLVEAVPYSYSKIIIMPAEDGLLGLAGVDGFSLHLWSRVVASIDGAVSWTRCRVIDLEKLIAPEILAACIVPVEPAAYAEDAHVIFIYVNHGMRMYMIHLRSMRIEEVPRKGACRSGFPYTSFYTPGITTGGGDDQAELLNIS
ncbi:uncharacterized protein [Aegilops tauschii subsp. strangulata]|uniref:Peroxisomal membrane protein PEX14 n=1 Tax=Aegilops tauschii subsp. strangulata TaxID=200361 RepID=A0A453MES5_AEGTS|nr:uncharacterized protein LOC109745756 isoform X1 [Aegilops tauschii subsp. strangulata]